MSSRRLPAVAVVLIIALLPCDVLATSVSMSPATQPANRATTQAAQPADRAITPGRAIILGIVEGITEYLPVSSTGHLILAGHFLGLDQSPEDKEAVDAFEVIIQIGAVLAVVGLYRRRVKEIFRGLAGRNPDGFRLFLLLLVGFLPAAVIGLAFNKQIKAHLFAPWPVIAAMAAGGVFMILVEKWRKRTPGRHKATIESMTFRMALIIGFAQCLAMWPGTSRSMITILAAVLVGLEIKSAAEFSFLLALPTLSGAAVHDTLKHHAALGHSASALSMILGLGVSALVAALAVKSFVAYLNRRGLEPFGYYRIALAVFLVVMVVMGRLSF